MINRRPIARGTPVRLKFYDIDVKSMLKLLCDFTAMTIMREYVVAHINEEWQ